MDMTQEARTRFWPGVVAGGLAGALARELDLASAVSYWGDRQILVVAAALLGGLLALTRLRPFLHATLAVVAALWLLVCFTPLTSALARGLVRSDPVQAGDAVFVFGSTIQVDGDPSDDAASRLLRAVQLLADDKAPRLVLSELPPPAGRYGPLAQAWMGSLHVERELLTVGPVHNTREEALEVAALARARGFHRILAVTSPTHTRRACAALEQAGLSVVCVPSVETRFDLEALELPGDRVKSFGTIAHERLGWLVYARRGWVRP
jgi:uncharacterized SAM-binding protein YcdF (DUF218 family)